MNALARIRENRAFIVATLRDIRKRIKAYRYAIKRSRLEAPATSLARVKRLLHEFAIRAQRMEATFLDAGPTVAYRSQPGPIVPRADGPISLMPRPHRPRQKHELSSTYK